MSSRPSRLIVELTPSSLKNIPEHRHSVHVSVLSSRFDAGSSSSQNTAILPEMSNFRQLLRLARRLPRLPGRLEADVHAVVEGIASDFELGKDATFEASVVQCCSHTVHV